MPLFRTRIAVEGLSAAETQEGLPDLRAELRQRHWIICPEAEWEPAGAWLLVTVHYEVPDAGSCARLAHDEVWDCVIACVPAAGDLTFTVVEPARPATA